MFKAGRYKIIQKPGRKVKNRIVQTWGRRKKPQEELHKFGGLNFTNCTKEAGQSKNTGVVLVQGA
ncbi:hypothetical protein NE586_09580 [Gemmiger formicilis]|uniref:hypothetical protein n=1 Tax=Gemmiger formicilis TaxID=745368 RepID=UPI0021097005|nr:hypothetical protein [Gemmiger formicilis]MCQ5080140.1 hypothetical protein [Gemmiger formicilis]MCQ5116870.1 hypothetical protein [Gemmiger formicilis]